MLAIDFVLILKFINKYVQYLGIYMSRIICKLKKNTAFVYNQSNLHNACLNYEKQKLNYYSINLLIKRSIKSRYCVYSQTPKLHFLYKNRIVITETNVEDKFRWASNSK